MITGGGTGIGFGIAELLAGLGAHVVLASRKQEPLERACSTIRERGGLATAAVLDVRDPERVKAVVDGIAESHGRIDLLVNNAAGNFYAPSATLSPNAWRSVVEIDLFGTFYCSQAVYPVMAARAAAASSTVSMTLHYRGWPRMGTRRPPRPRRCVARTPRWRWGRQRIAQCDRAGADPDRRRAQAFVPPESSKGPRHVRCIR